MMDRYEGRDPIGRTPDARADARGDHVFARRIDCCDSPRSRERSGGGRGPGSLDADAYAARSRRPDLH